MNSWALDSDCPGCGTDHTVCVILGKLIPCFKTGFSHLKNEDNYSGEE